MLLNLIFLVLFSLVFYLLNHTIGMLICFHWFGYRKEIVHLIFWVLEGNCNGHNNKMEFKHIFKIFLYLKII